MTDKSNRVQRERWNRLAVRMACQAACEVIHQGGEAMAVLVPCWIHTRKERALRFELHLPRDIPVMEQWRCFGVFGPNCHPVAMVEDAQEWLACYDDALASGRNPAFELRQ